MLIIFIKKDLGERYTYIYISNMYTYEKYKFIVWELFANTNWINLCKFTNYRQIIIKDVNLYLKLFAN